MGTAILLPICVIKNILILHGCQERIYIVKTFHRQNWGGKTQTKQSSHTLKQPFVKHSLMHLHIL